MYHRVLTAPMAATVMFQYQGPSPCDPSSKGGQRCIMNMLIPIWYIYVNHHICIQWPFANGDSICTYSSCLKFLSSIYLHMGICYGDLHTRNLHTGIPTCKTAWKSIFQSVCLLWWLTYPERFVWLLHLHHIPHLLFVGVSIKIVTLVEKKITTCEI